GVVGGPHFVVKQLAAGVAQQLLQLWRRLQEAPGAVQLRNPRRQGAQQGRQALRPLGSVGLVMVGHPRGLYTFCFARGASLDCRRILDSPNPERSGPEWPSPVPTPEKPPRPRRALNRLVTSC